MKKRVVTLWFAMALGSGGVAATADDATPAAKQMENLTLDQALEMAETLQPQIAEAKAMVEAAEGRTRQAGAFPNPEAVVGAQKIPFGRDVSNEREYVAGVEQTIPLTRRLSQARQAERLEREVRARGLEVTLRDIHKRVQVAFATALYQEKAYQAQSEIEQIGGKAVVITQARVDAGDALREDLARAEMELARARVELQLAESLYRQSLVSLASAMGDAALSVKSVTGTLDMALEVPTLEAIVANLPAQPQMLLAEADVRASNARVDVAKAERIPDVHVELLYHRLEASQQNTVDLGLSIPLPLSSRNQGRFLEARAELAAAEARSRMTRNELTERLRESYLQLTTSLANSRAFRNDILPRADTVLKSAEARYAAGEVSLTETLSIRRDWAEVQLRYLESLRDVMQAWAQVKSLSQ